ncbi:MAG: transglutaminase family protein [Phycisphaerae bacterium]
MKLRKLFLASLLISSVSLADVSSRNMLWQRKEIQNNIVELNLSYDFFVPRETFRISLIVILPQTIPGKQKILSIKYSPKPSRFFRENGNRYAEFVFVRPEKRMKVEIIISAELLRYDLLTAREKREQDLFEDAELEYFLKQERHIEKDDRQIQRIAESIEGQTEVGIVKNIYNYVIDNLEYTLHGKKDWGAIKALQRKKGDCTEYADLFVAICRAKNIPARVVTGYTVRFDADSSKHNWAEVYLQKYGWVPFDPSGGDVENFIFRNKAFDRMRPVYLYLTNIRNDEVLDNYHFARYTYWGDRARLTDSIEFKQPPPPFQKTR